MTYNINFSPFVAGFPTPNLRLPLFKMCMTSCDMFKYTKKILQNKIR